MKPLAKKSEKRPQDQWSTAQQSALWLALLGSILVWASFPPLGLYALVPVGAALWLPIIVQEKSLKRSGYFWLWVAGSLMWLALLQGIRLAYWPLYLGWMALSLYLGIYLPLYVGLARICVHVWKWPLWLTAPLIWIGLEWIRAYAITGFAGCLLGHTLASQPVFLQIADTVGAYGVSGVIILVSVGLYALVTIFLQKRPLTSDAPFLSNLRIVLIAGLSTTAWVGYGWYRMKQPIPDSTNRPELRVALIQENSPTIFETNPDRNRQAWYQYLNATEAAMAESGSVDLVVWPESVFTRNEPIMFLDSQSGVPPELEAEGASRQDLEHGVAVRQTQFREKMTELQRAMRTALGDKGIEIDRTHFLLGSDVVRFRESSIDRYNAALWVTPDGQLDDYYAKQHLVMFGEYIPFGDWIPMFYRTLGMAPVRTGDQPKTYSIDSIRISPSICFENMIPQGIHRNVQESSNRGEPPDVLINVTNDGWFRGSSMLDHHLACGTLAAVENRRPMLIAANTGLSAWIDSCGRRVQVGKRMQKDAIIAKPKRDSRPGLWQAWGDLPAGICGSIVIGLALFELYRTRRTKTRVAASQSASRTYTDQSTSSSHRSKPSP